jgi:membrane associated rhomboid family serine protease
MSFDRIVVLICSALWLLQLVRLVPVSLRRRSSGAAGALAISAVALLITVAASWLSLPGASTLAVAIVVLFMLLPAAAGRAASRALKWGRITRARVFSFIAWLFRPLPAMRRFRRSVEISWRLNRGEAVDLVAAVATLGALSPLERAANQLAFTSWTDDFDEMARLLETPKLRHFALRGGMGAIVVMVVGEREGLDALLEVHAQLTKSEVLSRRSVDATWAILLLAAYLGELELVREHVADGELVQDVPPERITWLLATAAQRAGRPEIASEHVERALAGGLFASGRKRLSHRLEHPLTPFQASDAGLQASDAGAKMVADLRTRLHARHALAALGLGWRRPAPITWVMSLTIVASYLWQLSLPDARIGYRAYGLIAPYARAPEAYRLLSYGWLHLDLTHLGVNLIGLLLFGRFVERHFARVRFIVIYLLGAIAGGLAYLAWESVGGVAIGASGAVMAMFGATVSRVASDRALRRTTQGRRELYFLAAVALLQLAVDGLWAQSSGAAHAGGLVLGLLLGVVLKPRHTASDR